MTKLKEIGMWIWIVLTAIGAVIIQSLRIRNLKQEAKEAEEEISRQEQFNRVLKQQSDKQMEALAEARQRRDNAEQAMEEGRRDYFEND